MSTPKEPDLRTAVANLDLRKRKLMFQLLRKEQTELVEELSEMELVLEGLAKLDSVKVQKSTKSLDNKLAGLDKRIKKEEDKVEAATLRIGELEDEKDKLDSPVDNQEEKNTLLKRLFKCYEGCADDLNAAEVNMQVDVPGFHQYWESAMDIGFAEED